MRSGKVPSAIATYVKAGRVPYLVGQPGVGKSDLALQFSERASRRLIDFRLANRNPNEVKGYPVADRESRRMVWFPDEQIAVEGPCTILFDDLPCAPQATQAAAYEVLLSYRAGAWQMDRRILGDGLPTQIIIGAGNPPEGGNFSYRMPPALRSRLAFIEVEPSLDDWCSWALSSGVHRTVVGFLRFCAKYGMGLKVGAKDHQVHGLLFWHDPAVHTQSFPCPRTWKFVSDVLKVDETAALDGEIVGGLVSRPVGDQFAAFAKVAAELPDADAVVAGDLSIKPPSRKDARYVFCGALAGAAVRVPVDKRADAISALGSYCVKWFKGDGGAEFAAVVMADLFRTDEFNECYKAAIASDGYREYCDAFGHMLLGARDSGKRRRS